MNPIVSICVPTYNAARYLRQCMESALAQTFPDFELLLVDDHSDDDTVEIVDDYAALDSRIRLLRNTKNLGLVGNWNKCVEVAKGKWIKFLFQDDLLAPNCLARMLGLGESRASPLVTCRRDFIFEEGTPDESRAFYLNNAKQIENVFRNSTEVSAAAFREIVLKNIGGNVIGEPTVVLLQRTVFTHFGYFSPMFVAICDMEYWSRVGIYTGLVHVPETLATFRAHEASVSNTNNSDASHRYRMELDTVVLLHEFVFSPFYEPLRNAAAHCQPAVNLVNLLKLEARNARNRAELAGRDPAGSDATLLLEWDDVVRQYPVLSRLSNPSWSVSLALRNFVRRVTTRIGPKNF